MENGKEKNLWIYHLMSLSQSIAKKLWMMSVIEPAFSLLRLGGFAVRREN